MPAATCDEVYVRPIEDREAPKREASKLPHSRPKAARGAEMAGRLRKSRPAVPDSERVNRAPWHLNGPRAGAGTPMARRQPGR